MHGLSWAKMCEADRAHANTDAHKYVLYVMMTSIRTKLARRVQLAQLRKIAYKYLRPTMLVYIAERISFSEVVKPPLNLFVSVPCSRT